MRGQSVKNGRCVPRCLPEVAHDHPHCIKMHNLYRIMNMKRISGQYQTMKRSIPGPRAAVTKTIVSERGQGEARLC